MESKKVDLHLLSKTNKLGISSYLITIWRQKEEFRYNKIFCSGFIKSKKEIITAESCAQKIDDGLKSPDEKGYPKFTIEVKLYGKNMSFKFDAENITIPQFKSKNCTKYGIINVSH